MGPLMLIVLFIFTSVVGASSSGNIAVGAGYSADSQQMVSQKCYNATVGSASGQQGYIHLENALSFTELENTLGMSVSAGDTYYVFSVEAKASYLRSVKERDYSLSLNYYQYVTNNVAVQLWGYGDEALSESGRGVYKNGTNPYFGLLCGDYYISSYQQGALLTMGLNIKFSSSKAKEAFEAKAGFSTFGDLISAALKVKAIATENNINGSVILQAFQLGGDPGQLAKVLANDSSGMYSSLECGLTAMDKCVGAANGLLDYAKNEFSKQFSFENNTGLTPLGIAFTQYNPIKYIGLTAPPSLVTPEIVQYRNELYNYLKENEYYQEKLHPFFNKAYPVALDAAFMNNATTILSKANKNVDLIMKEHKGAADCFTFPDVCKSVKVSIDSQLRNITANDLKFLDTIKYAVTTTGGMFYNTGSISNTWLPAPNDKGSQQVLVDVNDVSVTDETYIYFVDARNQKSNIQQFYYKGEKNSTSMTYVGNLLIRLKGHDKWEVNVTNYKESKIMSPFYFDAHTIASCCNQQSTLSNELKVMLL